jgi:class 3 adenylate cyclase
VIDPRFAPLVEAGVAEHVADALAKHLLEAPDWELGRINALDFAARHGIDPERALDAFVHASRLGLVDLSYNLLCPGCGGVLGVNSSLRTVRKTHYNCSLCADYYELTLDELVEISFSVSPRIRSIPAHDPGTLPLWQYYRQMYFSPSLTMPQGPEWDRLLSQIMLGTWELAPGETVALSLSLPEQFLIFFEPVTHAAVFLDVKGEATTDVREANIVFTDTGPAPTALPEHAPGPLRITLENRTDRRILPGVFLANEQFHHLLEKRPFVTGKRLITNQAFRDVYRADSLDADQRLKIASLTVLFTDLKGSTELYERVGDLVAFDLVRSHFRVLGDAVRRHGGSVVKTIGDAVMATFPSADQGVRAALDMRDGIDQLNGERKEEDLLVKIGLHEGPCLVVVSNDRLDYFGQTVNIAARVQGLAHSRAIWATGPIIRAAPVHDLLLERKLAPEPRTASLKGIREEMLVYSIP